VKPPALQEPAKYKYVVKEKKGGAMSTVRCSVISRKNRVYTRDKNKLYLKLHCEPVDGVWKVKDESKLKFKLNSCKFDQFYAGPMPTFEVSSQKKKPASKKSDGKPGTEGSASKKSKTKDKKPDPAKHNKEEEKKKITTFDKWQESLKHVTSLSQVYLYLSTFEKSVMWDKSALHARCRLCRKKGDAERMLLCDGCDRGHHMDCLKPPIKSILVLNPLCCPLWF
ncbi:hypothetical protein LOTGIDRAFT_176500, partial [Lottia gigantea]